MIQSILLGVIQGLTEFLPVSSSGHLYIINSFYSTNFDFLPFVILLHLATLMSVIVFFFLDIKFYLKSRKMCFLIFAVTLTTVIVALVMEKFLSGYFNNNFLLGASFFATAAFLFLGRNNTPTKNIEDMSFFESVILGLVQGAATLPGVSRSGITISTLSRMGFKLEDAFKFSFIMSIPIIIGAFLFETKKLLTLNCTLSFLICGFVAAFIFGLIALFILRQTIKRKYFYKFAYYCIFLGVVLIFS